MREFSSPLARPYLGAWSSQKLPKGKQLTTRTLAKKSTRRRKTVRSAPPEILCPQTLPTRLMSRVADDPALASRRRAGLATVSPGAARRRPRPTLGLSERLRARAIRTKPFASSAIVILRPSSALRRRSSLQPFAAASGCAATARLDPSDEPPTRGLSCSPASKGKAYWAIFPTLLAQRPGSAS